MKIFKSACIQTSTRNKRDVCSEINNAYEEKKSSIGNRTPKENVPMLL
jgi:hypothetical protein